VKPDRLKRDELAEQISFLPASKMRRGKEALKEFLRLEKKGASKDELFQETGDRFADPDSEAGIFRGARGDPVFELSDEQMRIAPGMASYFDFSRGGQSPPMFADQTIEHPELFSRLPGLKKISTNFVMPQRSSGMTASGRYHGRGENSWLPEGKADMTANAEQRDINADDPFSLRGMAAHEIAGHGVQDRSGLPMGDNSGNHNMANAFERLVHPRAKAYRDELTEFREAEGLSLEDFAKEFPEADQYFQAASRLHRPARNSKKASALNWHDRYENVAGESEARRVPERMSMTAKERRESPDRPWLPILGKHAPFELQMLRTGDHDYSMPKDRGTLARLMKKGPL